MPTSILYYPTINIEDGKWLRNAILYWDEICSIIPYEGYADISPELDYLKGQDIYRPVTTQQLFQSPFLQDFCDAVCRRIKNYCRPSFSGRRPHPSIQSTQIHNDKIPIRPREIIAPGWSELLIGHDKIPPDLSDLFRELEELNFVRDVGGGWRSIDDAVGTIYMRTLAEFFAKNDPNLVIGTDTSKHINQLYPYSQNLSHRSIRPDRYAFTLYLNNCLPEPSPDVSLESLVDFKRQRQDELLDMRDQIRRFELALSACTTQEELRLHTEAFQRSWELQISGAEKMFRDSRIHFTLGNLQTFIVDAGGAAGLVAFLQQMYGPHPFPPCLVNVAVGAAGILGVGLKAMDYRRKINEHLHAGGFAYIVHAHRQGLFRA